jgi:CO/xanthine dehydrogenase Mo-binding subunit
MTEARTTAYIGQPLRRREDFKFITGKGLYTDDVKLAPGTLHVAFLRSPHAHATIKRVDVCAATRAPGIRLVLSGADLAGKIGSIVPNWILPGSKVPDRPVVAVDRVRFIGEEQVPGIRSLFQQTPSPTNPIGVKGIGESGAIAAPPCIVHAVLDALTPFNITHLDMPLTPPRIWSAIQQARTGASR